MGGGVLLWLLGLTFVVVVWLSLCSCGLFFFEMVLVAVLFWLSKLWGAIVYLTDMPVVSHVTTHVYCVPNVYMWSRMLLLCCSAHTQTHTCTYSHNKKQAFSFGCLQLQHTSLPTTAHTFTVEVHVLLQLFETQGVAAPLPKGVYKVPPNHHHVEYLAKRLPRQHVW